MKKKYCYLLLLLNTFFAQTQTFEWLAAPAITFSMNPELIGYPTAVDTQGNTYVCGYKDTPVSYGDFFGNAWFLKYDANGQLLFSKTITGTVNAYCMHIDTSGNVLIALGYIDAIAVDNFSTTTNLQGVKPILLKFSSNGDLLFHKAITGDFVEHFKAVTTDSQQNIYMAYDNYGDSYIEKLDANGNTLQLITQTNAKSVSSISVDTADNIYVAGSCSENNPVFGGTAVTNSLPYNTFVVKYNPAGQMQWVHFVEDVTCPEPKVVARTPDEVYFCSYLFGAFPFGSVTTEGPIGGSFSDFFLAKLDANGDYQWVQEVPGTGEVNLGNRDYLTLDNNGNIYIAAKTKGTIQWSPTIATQSASNNYDILILKYTPQGNLDWVKTTTGSAYDRTDGIAVATDGSIRLTGMLNGNTSLDAIQHNSPNFQYYPFVAKIDVTNLSVPTSNVSTFSVWPNPIKNAITITAQDYRGEAALYSLLGQKLKSFDVVADQSMFNLSEIAAGTYFLNLKGYKTVKVIKN
jgi:hypothetical protein